MSTTIIVHTATRIVLMAGTDITAATINAGKAGWCQDYASIDTDVLGWGHGVLSTASISIYEGVTLPAGFLPYCWTYSALGVWAQINSTATTEAINNRLLGNPWVVIAPTDVRITVELYTTNVASEIKVKGLLEWVSNAIGVIYEVEHNDGSGWRPVGQPPTESIIIYDIKPGSHQFRVRAKNSLAAVSSWAVIAQNIFGKTASPPPVDLFILNKQPGGARHFIWRLLSPPLDLSGYMIRYIKGSGGTWSGMLPLHSGKLLASPYETNQLNAGAYTFAICSIDTSGNKSYPVYIEATVDDPRLLGVLQAAYPQAENWPGVLTDCDIIDGRLEATGSDIWDTIPAVWNDWGAWNEHPATTIIYEYGPVDAGLLCSFTPLVILECAGSSTVEISTSNDDLTYTAWGPIALVSARYCKVRVTVSGAFPIIYSENIYLDGHPITEEIEDLDTSTLTGANRLGTGDIRLPIQQSYTVIKSVQVALQNVGPGWSWELIDKSVTVGPRIKIYNSSLLPADALIDITVKGLK